VAAVEEAVFLLLLSFLLLLLLAAEKCTQKDLEEVSKGGEG
jgi:hypothetical protein